MLEGTFFAFNVCKKNRAYYLHLKGKVLTRYSSILIGKSDVVQRIKRVRINKVW